MNSRKQKGNSKMIDFIKTKLKIFVSSISCSVVVLICNPAWAWNTFADYPVSELKVRKVEVELEIVTIESPCGTTAIFTVGDVVGQEAFTITAIKDFIIELESRPDGSGRIIRRGIPTEKFMRIETLPAP
jgi:hypothetical protein